MTKKRCLSSLLINWLHKSIGITFTLALFFLGEVFLSGCQKREKTSEHSSDFWEIGVKVINGTGVQRLAWFATWDLVNRGFNVYGTGDTSDKIEHTIVVDLKDPTGKNARVITEELKVMRRFLGLPTKNVISPEVDVKIDSSRFVEVLVILGEDYRRFFPNIVSTN